MVWIPGTVMSFTLSMVMVLLSFPEVPGEAVFSHALSDNRAVFDIKNGEVGTASEMMGNVFSVLSCYGDAHGYLLVLWDMIHNMFVQRRIAQVLWWTVIDDQNAVQVVDLMLDDACHEAAEFRRNFLPGGIDPADNDRFTA